MSRQSSAEFCYGTLCCETLRKHIIPHVLQSVNIIAGYTPPTIWHGRAIHLDSPAHMLNRLVIGAGEVAYGQPRVKDGCCNVQWVLFGFGWVLGLPWILGFLLPMCSYQRLKAPSYR